MNDCDNLEKSVMVKIPQQSNNLLLRKRSYQWENEVYSLDLSPSVSHLVCGDRFIPKRLKTSNIEQNKKFVKKEIKDALITDIVPSYWRQNNFISITNQTFGITNRRLFEFLDEPVKNVSFVYRNEINLRLEKDWPCIPRYKPLAFTDATHDLPEFHELFDRNLMDWSKNDQIAVSFGQDVIIWTSHDNVTLIFNIKYLSSLAYSPNGQYLAIACSERRSSVLELWDVTRTKDFLVINGKLFNDCHQSVMCIEWNKYSNEIVCGTNYGTMFVLSVPSLRTKHKVRKHKLPITIIRFSPTTRYLASGDVEGTVTIFNGSSYEVYLVVHSRRKVEVVFDWHPWNGVDLAISERVPASIVILHVPSKEIVAYYQRRDRKIFIHSITFSKITGELLVSISKKDANGANTYSIRVMSSLDRIVDYLKVPEGGARFMMWSPDGKRLATAGIDETISIWKFLPDSKAKNVKMEPNSKMRYGEEFNKWTSIR